MGTCGQPGYDFCIKQGIDLSISVLKTGYLFLDCKQPAPTFYECNKGIVCVIN